jgi:hypothetical protein
MYVQMKKKAYQRLYVFHIYRISTEYFEETLINCLRGRIAKLFTAARRP